MVKNKPSIAVVIPAAGVGQRMNSEVAKQFIKVAGQSILSHTVSKIHCWANTYHHNITIMVTLSVGSALPTDVVGVNICEGGKTRACSVANALQALNQIKCFDWAMVHDAVRPQIHLEDIELLYQQLKDDVVGGILAKKVTSTVKRAKDRTIIETILRDDLYLAQTPQLFRFDLLEQSLSGRYAQLTDEASAVEAMGLSPKIVEARHDNIKITTRKDLHYLALILEAKS
ncbi:MAG: IspD/TarI family cytidylyltransferase [Ostreibacterium sp.]